MPDLAPQPPGFRFAEPAQEPPCADPSEPRQLKHWTAYRSGAALSVSGMDTATLRTITIAGISSLGPDAQGGVFITDATGQRWELAL